jgi:hypothetical protein
MLNHVMKGGNVALSLPGGMLYLSTCSVDIACFTTVDPVGDSPAFGSIVIDANKTVNIYMLDNTGSNITVDDALSSISTNPVQNKAVTTAFNNAIEEVGADIE